MNRRTSIGVGIAAASAMAALVTPTRAADAVVNPELEAVRALLKAHDTAMSSHDLDGVLATLSEKASIMGTGPGELWSTRDEIKVAYEHFFADFDKGQQDFEYLTRVGSLGTDMGWLMASGNVQGKKGETAISFPLNVSLTVAKADGAWKIAAMHFSTLTGEAK